MRTIRSGTVEMTDDRAWSTGWRRSVGILLAACAALLVGCGNLTVGGQDGEVEVVVSGDAADPSGTSPPSAASVISRQQEDDDAEGELEAEFTLTLIEEGGRAVPLTEQPIQIEVDVRGSREVDVVRRTVPAVRYEALRIDFTDIEVEIESGLVIDGVPVVGEIEVELEGETLTITRPIQLDLGEGDVVELLVDLNSQSWLRATDPDLRRVARAIVRDAIAIRIRGG